MGMKIDDYVNRFLGKFFPEDAQGNRTVYLHSQNLNEDKHGEPKGWPYHGRLWFHIGGKHGSRQIRFSWNLWSRFCGASIGIDGEDQDLALHWAIPPVSFWWTLPLKRGLFSDKVMRTFEFEFAEFRVFDWTLWWKFWCGEGWFKQRPPKWREGCFHFRDFVIGSSKYVDGKEAPVKVLIPMPEGPYEATVELGEDRWVRPRWFTQRIRRAKVDVPQGIPHEGKGESEWNCGEDRTYGISCTAETVEEAIGKLVQSVLRDRRRYNGNIMAVYPHPKDQVKPMPPPPDEGGTQSEASA